MATESKDCPKCGTRIHVDETCPKCATKPFAPPIGVLEIVKLDFVEMLEAAQE